MGDAPISILLVDDDEIDTLLFQRAVKSSGLSWQVSTAFDGVQALEYLNTSGNASGPGRPKLVLLDWKMPRLGGREVLKAIKVDANLRSIPVIVLTSSDDPVDVVEAYRLGANTYIRKPADLLQLKNLLKAIDNFWFGVVILPPQSPAP